MIARVMFIPDNHKRNKDITTIEGYVKCNNAVQLSLMDNIKKYNVTHVVHMGDWYDKGYTDDVSAGLADYDLDIQMANLVNGNFYGVIGNHIRLGMDSNPELYLIQPHPRYKTRRPTTRMEQIIKTPDYLRVGDVQISLLHHDIDSDNLRTYKPKRQEWAKYHVAVFHTEKIVPSSKLLGTEYEICNNSTGAIAECLTGVDLALVGHIHDPIGIFTVQNTEGTTTMMVPGSITNVNASEKSRHHMVRLPILTVEDDGSVKIETLPFDLKTNMLTFHKKNVDEGKKKLKTLRGKPIEHLGGEGASSTAILSSGDEALTSLNAFMAKEGYTDKDKNMIRSVLLKPDSLDAIYKIWRGEVSL